MASSIDLSPTYDNSSLLRAYNFDEVILRNLEQELKESNAQLRNLEKCVVSVSITALNMALIDNDLFLSDYIINFYARNVTKLNQKSTSFQISPLHLAVILGRHNLAEQMLKSGVNPNVQDMRGWTPILHAAVAGNQRAIEILIKFGADEKAMTPENGTYRDILRLTNLYKPAEDTPTDVFILNEENSLVPLSYKRYKLLTGSDYTSELLIDREVMIKNCKQPPNPDDVTLTEKFYPDLRTKYIKYRQQPSPILFQGIVNVGLGTYAINSYKQGDIVMEFAGHISNTPEINNYSLGNVNPKFIGSPASRSNDGFPNMALHSIINVLGAVERNLFIAIRDIDAGSQLCWDYGAPIRRERLYTELCPWEAREYIDAMTDFENADQVIEQMNKLREGDLNSELDGLLYLIRCLPVLFAMLLDESVPQPKVKLILEVAFAYRESYTGTPELPKYALDNLCRIANLALDTRKKLATFDSDISKEYFLFCQTLSRRMAFKSSVQGIEMVSKDLLAAKTLTDSNEIFEKYKKSMGASKAVLKK